MTLDEIKKRIIKSVDENKAAIIAAGEEILHNPEMGYCEEKTSLLVRNEFERLGLPYEYPLALTGTKALLQGKGNDINVCIIGEMDALKCSAHPNADSNSTAHACGHNAQVAAMLGAAAGLKLSGVMPELDGTVSFLAAPAEEFIDLDYRRSLKNEGKISFFSGKQQLISEGAFDDTDMAIMLHAQPNEEKARVYTRGHNLGFQAKTITFRGKAAHGSAPFEGTNALNAAALAILGIHSNRETFRDEDKIRIHPIITKGGDVVNSVPDEVCIDTYVRGATLEAIQKGSRAVDRSVNGAAQIIGASAEIENLPGYLPLYENPELSEIFENNAAGLIGKENIVRGGEITGSTDMGDLSAIIPVIQPSIGGFRGNLHGSGFGVTDAETAYVTSAKLLALTAAELLYNKAEKARHVLGEFVPRMTKNEYLKYLQGENDNVD